MIKMRLRKKWKKIKGTIKRKLIAIIFDVHKDVFRSNYHVQVIGRHG